MIQKRLHAVYLKAKLGLSNAFIGEVLDAHRNSVDTWIASYQEGVLKGLTTLNYRKRESELTSYGEEIKSKFSGEMIPKVAAFSQRISQLTGISRGVTQIRKFIHSLGFKYLQTGHIPAKADTKKQQQWKENILDSAIKEAEEGKCRLFFCDAAHFVLAPFVCKAWSLTRKFIKAAAGRNRINVLGALNAITKEVTTLINNTFIDAKVIMSFLHQLKEIYADKPIKIVLDNARYQHCKAVMELAASLEIELLFLPPYSPNLNIIERLWKFTKKKILYGQYYENPNLFHLAIRDFFSTVSTKYETELKSLLTLNFQF
ncbi:MAG: IS630 family transposase, partial [Tannerella sp.]|nr:IS630 family transposase [Tannerella sp.]